MARLEPRQEPTEKILYHRQFVCSVVTAQKIQTPMTISWKTKTNTNNAGEMREGRSKKR